MSDSRNGHFIYRFGNYELDPRQKILKSDGQRVAIVPRAFEVLVCLVSQSNEVVARESLIRVVWDGAFVEDANLGVQIHALRKLFSNIDNGISIETFPKVGYRLNADVTLVPNGARSNGHNGSQTAADQTAALIDTSPSGSRKRSTLAAGLLAVTVMVGGGGYLAPRFLADPSRPAVEMTRIPGTEQSSAITISPDGEYLAHAVSSGGTRTLLMTHLRSNSSIELRPASSTIYFDLVFSPDIRWLYFVSGEGETTHLYRMPVLGGPVVRILDNIQTGFDISPDGARLGFLRRLASNETAVLTAAIDGTDARVLASKSRPEQFSSGDISWSPDGRTIATAFNSGSGQSTQIVGVDIESGEVRPLSNRSWAGVDGIDWLPEGKELLVGLYETATSPTHIWTIDAATGVATKLSSDLWNYGSSTLTRDGKTILTGQHREESSIWVVPIDGEKSARRLTNEKYHRFQWIRWTSVNKILFASDHGGTRNIWVMNEDGSGARGLTEGNSSNFHPVATVDGRYVVFTSDRQEPGIDLWRMGANGEDSTRLTSGAAASQPVLTPDGRWIYFAAGEAATRSVWRVSIDGGVPERVVDGLAQWPAISPDGKYLAAYQKAGPQGQWKVSIFRVDDHSYVKSLAISAGTPIRWSSDGQGIAFILTEAAVSNIWLQPLDGSPAIQLTQFSEDTIVNFDISNDGSLICSRMSKIRDAYLIRNFR